VFATEVQYEDFNGEKHTEKIHFHMMTPEWVDLEFNPQVDGQMSDYVRSAFKTNDGRKIYTFVKLMLVNSYGRRSEDGAKFLKRPEFTEEFLNSPAYEEFFMWLVNDQTGGNMQKFWDGITPPAMKEKMAEIEEQAGGKKKLTELSRDELVALLQKKTAANEITA
jgi:hypothetical protein